MEITKELLEAALVNTKTQHQQADYVARQAEASVNKFAGAVALLEDLITHLKLEPPSKKPEDEPRTDISPENAEIQARDEARMAMINDAEEEVIDFLHEGQA